MATTHLTSISDHNFEQCLKCSICTVYCPVAAVNPAYPGPKQAGPDGERYRLKDPKFFDEALKLCLNCKRCEVACPSDVRIGDLIQQARMKHKSYRPKMRDMMLASTDLVGTMATMVAPITNFTLGLKPVKAVMHGVMAIDKHRTFPAYSQQKFEAWFNKNARDYQNTFAKHVSYFHGCYVNYNFPQLGKDFVTVMNAVGYGVHLLEKEKCCGVAMIANGMYNQARKQGEVNMASMRKSIDQQRPVLTTSSTCTFTMRDEYPELLGINNDGVRDNLSLATRFLFQLVDEGKIKLAFRPEFKMRIAYHTACHMQRMGWAIYSTELLRMIPGLELIELDQNCCGISGTYGFKKENYETSQAIGETLFADIEAAKPDYVSTDCETCKWQIEMSTSVKVLNPISILAQALDIDATRRLNSSEWHRMDA